MNTYWLMHHKFHYYDMPQAIAARWKRRDQEASDASPGTLRTPGPMGPRTPRDPRAQRHLLRLKRHLHRAAMACGMAYLLEVMINKSIVVN